MKESGGKFNGFERLLRKLRITESTKRSYVTHNAVCPSSRVLVKGASLVKYSVIYDVSLSLKFMRVCTR